MASGGKRAGAGRKAGSATQKTRLLANQAAKDGITPLEVMIENMRWHCDRAQEAGALAQTPGLDAATQDLLRKSAMACRQAAQQCAVDAGPYIHPRLASIQVGGDPAKPVRHVVEFQSVSAGKPDKV